MSSDRAPAPRVGAVTVRWVGVALTLLIVVAIVWLAVTGRLELYVHPRYTVFTVVLAVIGGVLAVAALVVGERDPESARPHRILTVGRVVLVVVSAVALLVLPPATLTAHTAQNRAPAGPDSTALTSVQAPLVGGSTASFSVKDWAALLRTGDSTAVAGRTARITAYVLPIEGARDEFYAARLLVTCCAVDAQPVAVPVHLEGWRDRFAPNTWVEIRGTFQQNPDAGSDLPTVLEPERIRRVPEPAKPYVY